MRTIILVVGALLLGGCATEDAGDACRATLLSDTATPWLHFVVPMPEGGYAAMGNAAPGYNMTFYRLDKDFKVVHAARLPEKTEAGRGMWRVGSHFVIGTSVELLVVDRQGEVLTSRKLSEHAHFSTGVHGVVPRDNSFLVLWASSETGLHLDELNLELRTLKSSVNTDVCCNVSLHGTDTNAFISGKLYSRESPLWYSAVTPQLVVQPQTELLADGTEHLSFADTTASGEPIVATRSPDGAAMLRRFGGSPGADRLSLPGSSGHFVTIRPTADRILVYDNPLDNYAEESVQVWSVATDLSEVRGPFTYGRGVDVVHVEETKEDTFRVLAYSHGWGNYEELWLYEGKGCTEADWATGRE